MVIPISAFTAVPNPQMLAFMGSQSFVMMEMAGEAWQYGKRRISAMSNEDFNKLTPEQVHINQTQMLQRLIPTIEKSMDAMTPMLETIISQYGDFMRLIIAQIPELIQAATGTGSAGEAVVTLAEPWWWKIWKNLFPSLPEAEARRGGQQVRTNDIEGLKKIYNEFMSRLSGGGGSKTEDPVSPPTNTTQTPIAILQQRWARVSTQTLVIKLKEVTKEFTALALKYNRKRDAATKKLYDIAQQLMHDLNTYLAYRASKSVSGGQRPTQSGKQLANSERLRALRRMLQLLKAQKPGNAIHKRNRDEHIRRVKHEIRMLETQTTSARPPPQSRYTKKKETPFIRHLFNKMNEKWRRLIRAGKTKEAAALKRQMDELKLRYS